MYSLISRQKEDVILVGHPLHHLKCVCLFRKLNPHIESTLNKHRCNNPYQSISLQDDEHEKNECKGSKQTKNTDKLEKVLYMEKHEVPTNKQKSKLDEVLS